LLVFIIIAALKSKLTFLQNTLYRKFFIEKHNI